LPGLLLQVKPALQDVWLLHLFAAHIFNYLHNKLLTYDWVPYAAAPGMVKTWFRHHCWQAFVRTEEDIRINKLE
jgi:hypothetical protein